MRRSARPRRLLSFAPVAALALAASLASLACARLNEPMPHPRSTPRTACFSDVECKSNGKCVKGPDDIQGQCTLPGASETAGDPERGGREGGGGGGGDGRPVTPPALYAPQPDDIEI